VLSKCLDSNRLASGGRLRYQPFGPSAFATPDDCGARYVLFVL
jgi:hypothetical protein